MSVPPSDGTAPPSDGTAPAGRRRIVMLPQKVLTPIALIAREGEERDALEQQVARTRPVVAFPSLAHFCTDSTLKERWAGVLLARTHAWDSRLDDYVPRRAFIALYGLTDEGYGWPDAVKRIATTEELEGWLTLLASPTLPDDDKPKPARPMRPRKERVQRINVTLAPVRAQVSADGSQLALPMGASAPATSRPANEAVTSVEGASAGTRQQPSAPSAPSGEARSKTTRSSRPARAAAVPAAAPAEDTRRDDARGEKRGEQLAFEGTLGAGEASQSKGRRSKKGGPAALDGEAIITRVALELGFARAEELLQRVRARAHEIARER